MTIITKTTSDVAETYEEPAVRPEALPVIPEPKGLESWLGTGDHKKIGKTFIAFALIFLVSVAGTNLLLGFERISQNGFEIWSVDTYFQALSLNSYATVYMAALPLLLGLAIFVVPVQVGSRSIAFPRAAATSLWGYIVASGLLIAAYAINGGPGGGSVDGQLLWVVAFGMLVVSLLLASVCVVTTVITARTPGMYLDRVPIFSWSMAIGGVLWIISLAVMGGFVVLAYLDNRYGQVGFGGQFDIYHWFAWTERPPQVFLYTVPALGIVGEIIPVMSRNRQRFYKTIMGLLGLVGVLGFGAYTATYWQQASAAVAGNTAEAVKVAADSVRAYDDYFFVAVLIVLPFPILALFGGWTDTMLRGKRPKLSAPLVYALLGALIVLAGALASTLSAIEPLELFTTSWVIGVRNFAVLGAVMLGLGGLHYWSVKIWGHQMSEAAGYLAALLLFAGAGLVGLGDLLAGWADQPDVISVASAGQFDGNLNTQTLAGVGNGVAFAGWIAFTGGILVSVLSFIAATFKDEDEVPANPWDGQTLEWSTSSPPPPGNFDEVAFVTSAQPLLDVREASGDTDGKGGD